MKATVLDIKPFFHESADIFAGSFTVKGIAVTLMWEEDFNGMFYIGNIWSGVPVSGKTACIKTSASSEAEALWMVQQVITTTNYELVEKTMLSKWIAKDMYGRDIECDSEEEAINTHKKFGAPSRIDDVSFSNLVCLDIDEILNLTQHTATTEQVAAGVVEPQFKEAIQNLLTFNSKPDIFEIQDRAKALAAMAQVEGFKRAMIGGAPFFMSALERELLDAGITPLYAFSERVSDEQIQPDGSIKKINIFKHVGFVEVS